ncbi:dTDP-glucose 4,6-dehydratase [archaeon HR01]|nr:dTDP-glucose 4,6-dehydratase [archaeon HR01]
MRILVTGSRGFIGRHLTEYLAKRGYEVLEADIAEDSALKVDVSSPEDVFNKLSTAAVDAIVHLAAIADIPKTVENPYQCFRVNCFGTLNMLELASHLKVSRFIYLSSANYYGAPEKIPVEEDDRPAPRTPYDYSKVASENFVWSYHRTKKLPVTVLRPWKTFGEYEQPSKVVPRFVKACLTGQPIQLYNHGRDVTDLYHVENLCHVIDLCLRNDQSIGHAFNVGTGNKISVRELAELIKKLTKSETEIQLLPPRTAEESTPQISIPSIKKLQTILGFKPQITLEEGIRRIINYYEKNLP